MYVSLWNPSQIRSISNLLHLIIWAHSNKYYMAYGMGMRHNGCVRVTCNRRQYLWTARCTLIHIWYVKCLKQTDYIKQKGLILTVICQIFLLYNCESVSFHFSTVTINHWATMLTIFWERFGLYTSDSSREKLNKKLMVHILKLIFYDSLWLS
jgi:hypothetical protein